MCELAGKTSESNYLISTFSTLLVLVGGCSARHVRVLSVCLHVFVLGLHSFLKNLIVTKCHTTSSQFPDTALLVVGLSNLKLKLSDFKH